MRATLTLAGLLAFSGCASLQHQPEAMLPPSPERPVSWGTGETAPVPPVGNWISGFGDPVLSGLVSEALENNPGLSATYARVKAARATALATYGRSLPSLNGGADASWSSSVIDVNDKAIRNEAPSLGLSLGASWEPDLWGRIANGVAAADADLSASESDLAAAQLSLAARTAIAWIQLNDAVRQEALAEETLAARERTLRLTERRFRNGLTAALDVRLSRSTLESAKASLSSRQQRAGEARRAIEVLLGRYPANELEAVTNEYTLAPIIGAGDPTSLLSRRPDIAAAEARISASGFRVDQARLALRPSLSLSASLFTSNADLKDVLDPAFLAGRIASSLTAPLYNGGALKANIEAADAQAQIASANYVSAVLTAWQEVENSLAADEYLQEQVSSQVRALEEARLAENLAERQYQNGLSSIFNLIDAQTRRINAQGSLISVQTSRAINRVQFHLALGGELSETQLLAEQMSEGTNS
jgi:NodT family efflux transporter outer membrane factor (OMF) lipoprotein